MEITRPEQLNGCTYKIKAPNGNGDQINIYVTINDDAAALAVPEIVKELRAK